MDICGPAIISPRIGKEYQAKLPLVPDIEELHYMLIQKQVLENEGGAKQIEHDSRLGLPIPVLWVTNKGHHVNEKKKDFSVIIFASDNPGRTNIINNNGGEVNGLVNLASNNSYAGSNGKMCKVETSDGALDPERRSITSKPKDGLLNAQDEERISGFQTTKFRDCIAFPGSHSNSWADAEIECFLLGLYIFGKNFVNVVRFMEGKKMGDVLSFYYGKFYRSDAHRKWSDCKKFKNRRFVLGQRIFSGWRQDELLSRLLPHISEQNQEKLKQVALSFSDGRISLEDYVFALKEIVGLAALVQAIGLGKGKPDLTRVALDPLKENHILPFRSEIPKGKALSSLTCEDIITYLTGNFRLSKTRSNDLFWEAVWPRLLARGWHSEQPKNQDYVTSKNSLVFLFPGVKKFSRRKLVKGSDYFDSVSDVLDKVASEPMLLELEAEMSNENAVEDENGYAADVKLDQDSSSYTNGQNYLHPILPRCTPELMRFTVVDTSQVLGEAAPKMIRELKSLPTSNVWRSASSGQSNDNCSSNINKQYSRDVSLNHQETLNSENNLGNDIKFLSKETNGVEFHHEFTSKKKTKNRLDSDVWHNNPSNGRLIKDAKHQKHRLKSGGVLLKRKEMIDPDIYYGNKWGNDTKCFSKEIQSVQFLREVTALKKNNINGLEMDVGHGNPFSEQPIKVMKSQKDTANSGKPIYLSPISKKRKLTACEHSQSDCYGYLISKRHHGEEKVSCSLKAPNGGSKECPDERQCATNTSSPCKASQTNSGEVVVYDNSSTKPFTPDYFCKNKVQIDLNIPYYPPDFVPAESYSVESSTSNSHCDLSTGHALSVETEEGRDNESRAPGRFVTMHAEQQSKENTRRQGTRNRPPTAKALEAVASGFLTPWQRGSSSRTALSATSKSSCRARKIVKSSVNKHNRSVVVPGTIDSSVDSVDERCRDYTNESVLFSKTFLDQGSNGPFG